MKLAAMPRYDRLGASSRLRMFQFGPALRAEGIETQVLPFLDDAYLTQLYAKQSTLLPSLRAYARLLGRTPTLARQDLLWIEKEALPWLPWGIEKRILPRDVPIVSDYDDAVFHRYDMHRAALVRRHLGHKIDQVMAQSVLVMAGNAYLAARAQDAGASWVEIVPTVVDLAQYHRRPAPMPDRPARIGWIGTPSTWAEFLVPMLPLLTDMATAHAAQILIVGSGLHRDTATPTPLQAQITHAPWTEASEVARIQDMDIGIMPLQDTPWARGKCGYKLIQYMACGLPVIAAPVGVNAEIVEDGVNGFLVSTQDEWRAALTCLLADPDLRRKMGEAGRCKVETDYSLQVWGPKVAALLRRAAGQELGQ
jgi:glycosyltransferase involved in cell wall biosynthesis